MLGGNRYNYSFTQLFRDVTAWYHIVVAVDTTQSHLQTELNFM